MSFIPSAIANCVCSKTEYTYSGSFLLNTFGDSGSPDGLNNVYSRKNLKFNVYHKDIVCSMGLIDRFYFLENSIFLPIKILNKNKIFPIKNNNTSLIPIFEISENSFQILNMGDNSFNEKLNNTICNTIGNLVREIYLLYKVYFNQFSYGCCNYSYYKYLICYKSQYGNYQQNAINSIPSIPLTENAYLLSRNIDNCRINFVETHKGIISKVYSRTFQND